MIPSSGYVAIFRLGLNGPQRAFPVIAWTPEDPDWAIGPRYLVGVIVTRRGALALTTIERLRIADVTGWEFLHYARDHAAEPRPHRNNMATATPRPGPPNADTPCVPDTPCVGTPAARTPRPDPWLSRNALDPSLSAETPDPHAVRRPLRRAPAEQHDQPNTLTASAPPLPRATALAEPVDAGPVDRRALDTGALDAGALDVRPNPALRPR